MLFSVVSEATSEVTQETTLCSEVTQKATSEFIQEATSEVTQEATSEVTQEATSGVTQEVTIEVDKKRIARSTCSD